MPVDDAGLEPRKPEVHACTGGVREALSCPPVLVLAFNRPDTTRRVLESLRSVRPGAIFFAVDGPRSDRQEENEQVAAVRRLADVIDWDCRIHTLSREENLGCKLAISQAITWFFSEMESGIVVEDECIADPSFFRFAAELLDRYRDDERVIMVSGDNFQLGRWRTADSYYFSRYAHVWGWATWRRAWRLYDHAMASWPKLRNSGWLTKFLEDKSAANYWARIFDETHGERNTSWAYCWVYAAWANGGLTASPNMNLISNVGFGAASIAIFAYSRPVYSRPAMMALPRDVRRCGTGCSGAAFRYCGQSLEAKRSEAAPFSRQRPGRPRALRALDTCPSAQVALLVRTVLEFTRGVGPPVCRADRSCPLCDRSVCLKGYLASVGSVSDWEAAGG